MLIFEAVILFALALGIAFAAYPIVKKVLLCGSKKVLAEAADNSRIELAKAAIDAEKRIDEQNAEIVRYRESKGLTDVTKVHPPVK